MSEAPVQLVDHGIDGPEWTGWNSKNIRALISGVMVLTLGVIGSAILPMPYAFATTGAVLGTILAVIVALCNVYTCMLLVRCSVHCGARDYESLAYEVGGFWFRIFTEFSIAILLIGTIIGAMIQIGEVGAAGLEFTFPDTAPGFLTYRGGMAMVVFFTLVVIFPLSMLKDMRMLDTVGAFATLVVFFLMLTVIIQSSRAGLPALKDGSFAPVNQGSISDVASSFSLFGFAFYLQAIMMPLLNEMPAGRTGAKITNWAATITILGVAFFTYFFTGFFGASMYGYTDTPDNVLNAQWFGGSQTLPDGTIQYTSTAGQFVLNLLMTIYLAISLPPIMFACCLPFDSWLSLIFRARYDNLSFYVRRFCSLTIVTIISLAVSLAAPDQSGNVLTVTGATGVVLVSYLIPIVSHFMMLFGWTKYQREAALAEGASTAGGSLPASPLAPSTLDGDGSHRWPGTKNASPAFDPSTPALDADGRPVPGLGLGLGYPSLNGDGSSSQDGGKGVPSDDGYPTIGGAGATAAAVPVARPSAPESLHHASVDIAAQRANLMANPHLIEPRGSNDGTDLEVVGRTATMTTIGYFRVPRVYHAPSMSRPVYYLVELFLPAIVLAIGVLDGVATLILLSNTINDD